MIVKDKRGRSWETFIDSSYFHMSCVRPVGVRDFNSQLAFHFETEKKAWEFLRLIQESS